MKLLFTNIRIGRAHHRVATTVDPADRGVAGDDSLGRGMDIALTLLVFLGLGWLADRWLGTFPAFTIALVLLAAAGTFVKMRYTYEAAMQRLEAERHAARTARRTAAELDDRTDDRAGDAA
jgi:hypothetical protein